MGIEINGLDEIMKSFEGMPRELKKAESQITKEMCKPIQEDAVNNIKRSNIKHEHIKDNIKISSMKYVEGIATRKVEVERKKSEIFWDYFIEYGTSKRPPKPFMGKARENNKNKIVELAQKSVIKILKKVEN